MSEIAADLKQDPNPTVPRGCPVMQDFDPIEASQLADPYERTAKARQEQPVFYMPEYDLWCLTRYEDILAVLSDPITYSKTDSHEFGVAMPEEVTEEVGADYVFPDKDHVDVLDPPEHTRLRKLLQPAFTPRRVAHFAEPIERLADEILDQVEDRGRMDLAEEYAGPIPVGVIATIIGLDPHAPEVSRFREWADSHFQLQFRKEMDPGDAVRHWNNLIEWDRFITGFVARNRENPGDNMTSDWMNARSDEGVPKMSDQELLSTIIGMHGAGSDTTANLISQVVYRLLRDDHRLWEEVVADRSLIPGAVEETMRFMGPVRGVVRTVKEDVRFRGVEIPAGSKVYLSLASANYDEDKFEDSGSFDIARGNAKEHLGFGLRTHFCIGSPLARLEAKIALERLADRLPDLRLADPEQKLEYTPSLILPGVHRLDVVWG
jgi:cytochrome P450